MNKINVRQMIAILLQLLQAQIKARYTIVLKNNQKQ